MDTIVNNLKVPWPSIIMLILGLFIVVYTAIAPGVNNDRRVFGVILILLWTFLWALILFSLWNESLEAETWWLLIIPVSIMAIFFIIIIILDVGTM